MLPGLEPADYAGRVTVEIHRYSDDIPVTITDADEASMGDKGLLIMKGGLSGDTVVQHVIPWEDISDAFIELDMTDEMREKVAQRLQEIKEANEAMSMQMAMQRQGIAMPPGSVQH